MGDADRAALMGGGAWLAIALSVAAGVVIGLVTGNWNPAIGLGIGAAFLGLIEVVFPA